MILSQAPKHYSDHNPTDIAFKCYNNIGYLLFLCSCRTYIISIIFVDLVV